MKKTLFIFMIGMFIFAPNVYAYDNYFFQTGISLYSSYDIYFNDLSNANKNNYSNQFSNWSMVLNFGVYRRWTDKLIMGVKSISGFHDIENKKITNKSFESENPTFVGFQLYTIEGIYFFNKIYNGFCTTAGIGLSQVSLEKEINNEFKTEMEGLGVGAKLGFGYSFNINPDESAILVGFDMIYLNAQYKFFEKDNMTLALANFSLYASTLW